MDLGVKIEKKTLCHIQASIPYLLCLVLCKYTASGRMCLSALLLCWNRQLQGQEPAEMTLQSEGGLLKGVGPEGLFASGVNTTFKLIQTSWCLI